jgi:hypothetical protein
MPCFWMSGTQVRNRPDYSDPYLLSRKMPRILRLGLHPGLIHLNAPDWYIEPFNASHQTRTEFVFRKIVSSKDSSTPRSCATWDAVGLMF